jgi:hypothetical protein
MSIRQTSVAPPVSHDPLSFFGLQSRFPDSLLHLFNGFNAAKVYLAELQGVPQEVYVAISESRNHSKALEIHLSVTAG